MADGEARQENGDVLIVDDGVLKKIVSYRQTPIIAWALVSAATLIAIVFFNTFAMPHLLQPLNAKLYFVAGSVVFWLPLVLLLRDSDDNLAHGPSLTLPLISNGLLAAVVGFVVFDKHFAATELLQSEDIKGPLLAIILSCLILCFVPLIWNAINISRFAEKETRAQNISDENDDKPELPTDIDRKDAEAAGALSATLVAIAISSLAYSAGKWGSIVQIQSYYGVVLSAFIVCLFGAVVFLEPLSKFRPIQFVGRNIGFAVRMGRPLAWLYNSIDAFFVKVLAVAVGMEHRDVSARYGILSFQLFCLCLLGWNLPPGPGLAACGIGVILALSVSRLWSWVEDDRALALLTDFKPRTPYRTQMKEDYRDETLLGFIFVFALLPIIMCQLHASEWFGKEMFKVPDGETGFFRWLGFFGIELAKAVPIVDWAEIYQIQQSEESGLISLNGVPSQHTLFIARVTVDLVLIAALLQAIGISNRNRQQKLLFRAGASNKKESGGFGLIDRLDKFVEQSELKKSIAATVVNGGRGITDQTSADVAYADHFDLSKLNDRHLIDFRKYNADRLQEIYAKSKNATLRAFIAAISLKHPDLTLKSRQQLLEDLAETGRSEADLYAVLERLRSDFERDPEGTQIENENLWAVLFSTRNRPGLKAFKKGVIDLMVRARPNPETLEYLTDVAGRSNPDRHEYAKVSAVEGMRDLAISHPETRSTAVALLNQLLDLRPRPTTRNAIEKALGELT